MSGRRERETILLTVDEIGDRFADVGPTSSVLALARELNGSDESSYLSLYVHRLARTLSPNLPALSADIRSGDVIRVVLAEPEVGSFLTSGEGEAEPSEIQGATLHMLSGPLSGSAYQLELGHNRVGRVSDNDVVLVDAGVSRNHATITVDPQGVKITDNQSTNGIRVDGQPITEPTAVQSGQRVLLGRCWVTITFAGSTAPDEMTEREAAKQALSLERSPRTGPSFEKQTVSLPAPPTTGGRRRRPGGVSDQVVVDQFNISVGTMTSRLNEMQETEAAVRRAESPSTEFLASQIFVEGKPNPSLLWQREASDPDGLDVRLGLATQLSRTKVVVPPGGDQELRAKVVEFPERYRTVPNVPAVINLREVGSVGVYGSTDVALSLTRSMIAQLAAHHGPDQLGLLYRCGEESREWDWLKWLPHVTLAGSPAGFKESEFVSAVSTFLGGAQAKRNNRPRPPAIVVLIDEPGSLPPALFPRLIQEGPDVGVYTILLGGDDYPYDVPPASTIRVGVETANLSLDEDSHVGGITIESVDRPTAVAMARTLTAVNYRHAVPLSPLNDGNQPASEELVVGRFELGGAPPPSWPTASEADTGALPVEPEGSASDDVEEVAPADAQKLEQAEPEQVEPEQAELEQAEPEQAEPEQAELEQAEPEQADPAHEEPAPSADDAGQSVSEDSAGEVAKAEASAAVAEAEATESPVDDVSDGDDPSETQETPETVAAARTNELATGTNELDLRDDTPSAPPPPPPPPSSEEEDQPSPVAGPDQETERQPRREQKLLLTALPPADGDGRLILGTVRVPDRPNPAVFAMNLPRDGSLGLVGPAGCGRTSALQSVGAATALLTVDPDAVPIVYYLDVPGGLDGLQVLPNAVGAAKNDIDGFRSVTADLERLLIDRRAAFDELGAANLDEYRYLQPGANLRRIVTLIDNIAAFGELMEALQPGRFVALLAAMLDDGPALGVHLVFTGDHHNDLGQMLGRKVGRWLTLGGGGPEGEVRPGRAMVGRNEVRFAVVGNPDPEPVIANIGAKLLANGATPINSPSGPVQAAG